MLLLTLVAQPVLGASKFFEYPVPTPSSVPDNITVGPDGNIWFTEMSANKIATITNDGHFIEYTVPTANSSPAGITTGPDGNLWFREFSSTVNQIGKVTTRGVFTEYSGLTAATGDLPG